MRNGKLTWDRRAVTGSGDVYLLCETVPWGESNCKMDGEAATIKGFVE
jgi:hypothetical protein